MGSLTRTWHPRYLRFLHNLRPSILLTNTASKPILFDVLCIPSHLPQAVQYRGAKSVSRRRVKDLTQGVISSDALPAQEPDDAPRYPALLQGVKNNMARFEKCVVLTRVGNFYELYFEHADEFGPLLGLKVATKHTALGPVAMAGFPFWQLDRFLKILVQDLNKYVALSEEFPVASPEKIKSGGLQYERKVARVVTPGTLIDELFLDPYQNNFLLAVEWEPVELKEREQPNNGDTQSRSKIGLAWLDLSTGDFFTQTTSHALLAATLMRISPCEILLAQDIPTAVKEQIGIVSGHSHELITLHDPSTRFNSMSDWDAMLEEPVPDASEQNFPTREKLAGHRLLDYVRNRLQDFQLRLRAPKRRDKNDMMIIDRGSLRGLEILETAKDGLGRGSLFHAVKRTMTKGGARLLRDRLTAPSASLNEINERLDLLTIFYEAEDLRDGITQCLKRTFDANRIVQKFVVNKGDADDMLCLARAISETSKIHNWLKAGLAHDGEGTHRDPLQMLISRFTIAGPAELSANILHAIDEEGLNEQHRIEEIETNEVATQAQESVMKTAPEELASLPRKARPKYRTSIAKAHYEENENPWIMRKDASESLERLHLDLESLKAERTELQERLKNEFGTAKLELKWTPGLGHVCHITSVKTLDDTLVGSLNAKLISSSKSTRSLYLPAWSRLGEQLAQARLNIQYEESRIFRHLRQQIIDNLVFLRRNAAIIDEIDVTMSFASLAQEQGWSRPILNNSLTHKIVGGRHPTVKLGLEEQGRTFVSNDLFLGESERLWIVTGPNMAGKSTFLRQNALITILAQVGSYVPAAHAELGLVDQMFSRIGAADDLFRDQSTFMVEMLETAAILKHATARSFVIMDEVGRGTTPEDGTAVSFASLHHLYHVNKSRTLFATHFHALIDMTDEWANVGRYCTDIVEDQSGSFSFVHKLEPGVNRHSHALKVAKMAGLPDSALSVAELVQKQLMRQKYALVGDDTHQENDDRSSLQINETG